MMRVQRNGRTGWLDKTGPRRATAGLLGGGRGGLTLVELLAAMTVLLVGVYAVAALFPRLARTVTDEETRTSMSRAVDRVLQRYSSGADETPDATAPVNAVVNSVDPTSEPEDPDTSDFAENPLNARDDFIWVYGERVVVPSPTRPGEYNVAPPATPGGYPCHVLKMGLLHPLVVPTVTELTPLRQVPYDPANPTLAPGEFRLLPNGQLEANTGTPWVSVYYDWVDPADGLIKRMAGETVQPGGIVQAARPIANGGRGGRVIAESARAYGLQPWSVSIGSPSPGTLPPSGTACVVDPRAGQAIYFTPSAAGRIVKIDYALRREKRNPADTDLRRALIMGEDKVLPSSPPFEIQLNFGHLSDDQPLYSQNYGGASVPNVYLLMVDLSDGTPFVWDETGPAGSGGAIEAVDFVIGRIRLNGAILASRLGNPVRVYYRTADQTCIQVQKVPSEFVEVTPGITPAVPNWEHRSYQVELNPPNSGIGHVCLHSFPAYCEEQAVQVDYMVQPPGQPTPRRIVGEIHVIGELDPQRGFGFTLNEPYVVGVLAVRGVSVRVCGWWRTETGRIGRLDAVSMLFPGV